MLMRNNSPLVAADEPGGAMAVSEWSKPSGAMAGALDLRTFVRILRWRARLVVVATLATALLVLAGLTIVPAKFKATTILLLDPREPRVTSSEAVLSGIGSDAAAVESQVELIQSSVLAEKVIAKLDLAGDPEFTAPSLSETAKNWVLSALSLPHAPTPSTISRLVERFERGLTVKRRGLTYIIEVNYSSADAEKATRISSAVSEAYLADQQAARSALTGQASDWLLQRIDEMRERLRKSEQAVADYKQTHQIVDVTRGDNLIARQIEDLNQQLALARTHKAQAGSRLEQVRAAGKERGNIDALAEVLQSPVISNLRNQYSDAARLEAQYSGIYADKHPALIAVRSQLAVLREQIDSEIGHILASVGKDYDAAQSQEQSLEGELAKLKRESGTLGETDVALGELEREAQADRALFEQFLGRVKETSEQQSLQIADARIVSPALVPTRPERPATSLLLLVASACGLIFGVGLALVAEQLRRGLRTPGEIEQWLGIPGLGFLPEQAAGRLRRRKPHRHAIDYPASDFAAGLWALATRCRRAQRHGTTEVLAVVSALSGEGKSTVSSNLALAFASSGVRTLLIDGDPHAKATTRFYKASGPGLGEVLSAGADRWSVTVTDRASGLSVLGAGIPTGLSDEKAITEMLRDYGQDVEMIVVDTPAILSIEGGAWIDCADRIIMVVEWGVTERDSIRDALAMLGRHRGKLAGIVLNKAPSRWCRIFDRGRYLRYYARPAEAAPGRQAAPPALPAPAMSPAE
jgi:succinoglycan biosynthesis transport protein ExoP